MEHQISERRKLSETSVAARTGSHRDLAVKPPVPQLGFQTIFSVIEAWDTEYFIAV